MRVKQINAAPQLSSTLSTPAATEGGACLVPDAKDEIHKSFTNSPRNHDSRPLVLDHDFPPSESLQNSVASLPDDSDSALSSKFDDPEGFEIITSHPRLLAFGDSYVNPISRDLDIVSETASTIGSESTKCPSDAETVASVSGEDTDDEYENISGSHLQYPDPAAPVTTAERDIELNPLDPASIFRGSSSSNAEFNTKAIDASEITIRGEEPKPNHAWPLESDKTSKKVVASFMTLPSFQGVSDFFARLSKRSKKMFDLPLLDRNIKLSLLSVFGLLAASSCLYFMLPLQLAQEAIMTPNQEYELRMGQLKQVLNARSQPIMDSRNSSISAEDILKYPSVQLSPGAEPQLAFPSDLGLQVFPDNHAFLSLPRTGRSPASWLDRLHRFDHNAEPYSSHVAVESRTANGTADFVHSIHLIPGLIYAKVEIPEGHDKTFLNVRGPDGEWSLPFNRPQVANRSSVWPPAKGAVKFASAVHSGIDRASDRLCNVWSNVIEPSYSSLRSMQANLVDATTPLFAHTDHALRQGVVKAQLVLSACREAIALPVSDGFQDLYEMAHAVQSSAHSWSAALNGVQQGLHAKGKQQGGNAQAIVRRAHTNLLGICHRVGKMWHPSASEVEEDMINAGS